MRDGWRIELTQTITEKVDMAVTREQVDLLNSLQTMIDSKLSSKIFSKYRIRNLTGLKRILTSIMFFVRKATKTDTNMRHECYPS